MILALLVSGRVRSRRLKLFLIRLLQKGLRPVDGCALPLYPGFAAVKETFTQYDEPTMRFAYQATEGCPWFLTRAENHWAVRSLGPDASLVQTRAELHVRLFPGLFLAPLLKLQMGRIGVRTLEELKYYVEHDQVHPRKLKAQRKRLQESPL
jgi:hypothetical protein